MYVIRKSDLVALAAENWRVAHQRRNEWLVAEGKAHPEEIYKQLKALPDNATQKDVDAITGDSYWTANICQECGEDRQIIVAFGAHETDHPTDSAYLCIGCLEAGVQLARARAKMNVLGD